MQRRAALATAVAVALAWTAAPVNGAEPIATAKPMADLWDGMTFFCASHKGVEWSGDACREITAEARRLAEAGEIPFAVLNDDAVTFDADRSLSVLASFDEPRKEDGRFHLFFKGQSKIGFQTGGLLPGWWTVFTQESLFDAVAEQGDAEKAAKQVLSGYFEYLTKQRQP